jgi:hypothetical protein
MPEVFVRTAQEEGWAGFKNGSLLRLASGDFDVLLTVDQRMRYQQNLAQFDIGVIVVETFDTTLSNLRRLLPEIRTAIETVTSGTVFIVKT